MCDTEDRLYNRSSHLMVISLKAALCKGQGCFTKMLTFFDCNSLQS